MANSPGMVSRARYQLIVLDLDGTALDHTGRVCSTLCPLLEKAEQQGLRVTVATGRRWATAQAFVRELGVKLPVVVQNGALVVDVSSNTAWVEYTLPPNVVAGLVDAALADPKVDVFGYTTLATSEQIWWTKRPTSAYGRELARLGTRVSEAELRAPAHGYVKIGVYGPRDQNAVGAWYAALPPSLRSEESAAVTLYRPYPNPTVSAQYHDFPAARAAEFLAPGRSKAAAVADILRKLNLGWDDVVAFGDDFNDLELLQQAGLGIAMANAAPEVQSVAKAIAPRHDEQGVARALEAFVLQGR